MGRNTHRNGARTMIGAVGPAMAAVLAAGLAAVLALGSPATAQPAGDPRLAAAQAGFDALPEAERKAIQTDLIWTGRLSALASGSFGPLTFRAINAAKAAGQGGGAADGLLTPAERQALAAAAAAARKAAGFRIRDDARTGVRIGVPTALLVREDVTPSGGSRWQSADGRVTLDTSSAPTGDGLGPLFERATSAAVKGRRITYKLLRPDFFVVSGETGTGKFYRRLSAGPDGLRGFSIGYDKALAQSVDRLVIAIANSFEAFPSGPVPAGESTTPVAAAAPPASPPRHRAGLAFGEGRVLVALAALEGCRQPRIAGRPAAIGMRDEALGLALLEGGDAALAAAPPLAAGTLPDDARITVLALGDRQGEPVPIATTGTVANGAAAPSVTVALQPGQAGAPVFDRSGRLAGILVQAPPETGLVAGIAPARSHRLVDAATLRAFLDKAGIAAPAADAAAPELSTGAIVAEHARALVPLGCAG